MSRVFLISGCQTLFAYLLAACSSGGREAPALRSLAISTGDLIPAFQANVTDYAVTSLNSLYPIDVNATTNNPADSLTIHGAAAQSGTASSITLMPDEDFAVKVSSPAQGSKTYTIHYLPPGFPEYTVSGSPSAGTEDVLFTPGEANLLIVDRSGAPLYYRTFSPALTLNFQQHQLADGIAYSANVGTGEGAWTLGADYVMDDHFRDTAQVQLLPHAGHDVLPAESHDFILLDEDHYVAMTYVQRTVDLSALKPTWSSAAQVMNAVVQEVDHGVVLFEWDSANVPSLYADSVDGNAFTSDKVSDYLHLNSLDIDPLDQNFIFSFRHANAIVKVDRATAKILWTLGGKEDDFNLTPDQAFSHQHDVRKMPDGSLGIFDNGNGSHQTRGISFVLDEVNRRVVSFRVNYTKPADEPQTTFMGSQRMLSGNRYFYGWGGWMGNSAEPAATEVLNGAPVWQLTFTNPQVLSYRALPVDRAYRTQ